MNLILVSIFNVVVFVVASSATVLEVEILGGTINETDGGLFRPDNDTVLAFATPFIVWYNVRCVFSSLEFASFNLYRGGNQVVSLAIPEPNNSKGIKKIKTVHSSTVSAIIIGDSTNLCPMKSNVSMICDQAEVRTKLQLKFTIGHGSSIYRSIALLFQCSYCRRVISGKTNGLQVKFNEPNAEYGSSGHFECNDTNAVLFYSQSPAKDNETECSYNAQWKYAKMMNCWTAPMVTLASGSMVNINEPPKFILIHGLHAVLTCKVDAGFPTPETEFWVGDAEESLPFYPNYTHHNQDAYCLYWSNFTKKYYGDHRNKSNIIRLEVQFPPVVTGASSCIKPNAAIKYSVTFFSNPGMNSSTLQFKLEGYGTVEDGNITNALGKTNGIQHQMLTGVLNISVETRLSLIVTSGQFLNHSVSLPPIQSEICSAQTTSTEVVGSTTTPVTTTAADHSSFNNNGTITVTIPKLDSSITIAAIAGGGGFFLVVLASLLVILIFKRRREADINKDVTSTNLAYCESSASNHGNSEREDRLNILYGTADELKSGGSPGTKVEVDNILYGSTPGPQPSNDLYSTVDKSNKKKQGKSNDETELYTTVQKTKKKQGKSKVVDPGASTSGLQSDDTYAVVNKDKKKKKDGKKAGKGQENSGFAGDAQQDATYAVVDKKKNKGAKGKKTDEPGPSGLVEEATYAVVNKKDKKPKKDGPDDDLHGSNKA